MSAAEGTRGFSGGLPPCSLSGGSAPRFPIPQPGFDGPPLLYWCRNCMLEWPERFCSQCGQQLKETPS